MASRFILLLVASLVIPSALAATEPAPARGDAGCAAADASAARPDRHRFVDGIDVVERVTAQGKDIRVETRRQLALRQT